MLTDTTDYVDATVGLMEMVLANGRRILEEEYRVNGEIWRVYQGDADPYPPGLMPTASAARNASSADASPRDSRTLRWQEAAQPLLQSLSVRATDLDVPPEISGHRTAAQVLTRPRDGLRWSGSAVRC